MKIVLKSAVIVASFAFSSLSFSQEVDPDLAEACQGDIDLTEYVVQAVSSDGSLSPDMFSAEEIDQIQSVLGDESLSELSTREKLSAVMTACSEGRILLKRFGSVLSNG